jgi:hypothetical protein
MLNRTFIQKKIEMFNVCDDMNFSWTSFFRRFSKTNAFEIFKSIMLIANNALIAQLKDIHEYTFKSNQIKIIQCFFNKRNFILFAKTMFITMNHKSTVTCWSRHWTLELWMRPLLVDFSFSLVLENRITSFRYYSIKSMLTTSRTGTRIIFVEEMNRHWSISTHLVTDQKTRII